MATNLPSCFSIQFLEQLLKFLVNFTLLKYLKSQRSYSLLITKELIFGFQILDLKDHFSGSLKNFLHTAGGLLWMAYRIRLGLDSAICLDDSFEFMIYHCMRLKGFRHK